MEKVTHFEDNTSGMGVNSVIPPEIRGWSWGAFLLNWIWGIGNSVFVAFGLSSRWSTSSSSSRSVSKGANWPGATDAGEVSRNSIASRRNGPLPA